MPYHLSDPTQAVALAAIRHDASLLATVEAIKAQRDRIVAELDALGYPPVPSDANFVLYGGLADARATWQALLDRGRPGPRRRHPAPPAGHRRHAARRRSAFLRAMADLPDSHRQHARDAAGGEGMTAETGEPA